MSAGAGLVRTLAIHLLLATAAFSEGQAAELCPAAPEADQARVAGLFAKGPHGPLFAESAGKALGLSETAVLSLLPQSVQAGTKGEHFAAVWKSLEDWPDVLFLITKGGNIFEIRDRAKPGAPSERSRFFNLATDGPGLSGHLRPDLMSAIFSVDMPGRDGPIRGITFHDEAGAFLFGAYVPSKHGESPDPKSLEAFEATRAAIQALPRLCPPIPERTRP